MRRRVSWLVSQLASTSSRAVDQLHQHLGDADVRPRAQHPLLERREAQAHRFARPHGFQPAHLVDAGRAERGGAAEEAVDQHAHHDRAGMIARRAQPADDRRLGGLLVEMDRLGVVGPREGDDGVLRHRRAAQHQRRADLDVLMMQDAPARLSSCTRPSATVTYGSSDTGEPMLHPSSRNRTQSGYPGPAARSSQPQSGWPPHSVGLRMRVDQSLAVSQGRACTVSGTPVRACAPSPAGSATADRA